MDPNDVALLVTSPSEDGGVYLYWDRNWIRLDYTAARGLSISAKDIYICLEKGEHQGEHTLVNLRQPSPQCISSTLLNDIHDVFTTLEFVYVAGTHENSIITLERSSLNIVKQWQFSDQPDSWHINSVSMWNGKLIFSAFGAFTEPRGYILQTKGQGFVRDVETNDQLISGLNMPHSLHPMNNGDLLIANTGEGELHLYDAHATLKQTVTLGGWVRGISVYSNSIYAGLSARRGGAPSQAQAASIHVIDTATWSTVQTIPCPFKEIYDIRCINKSILLDTIASIFCSQRDFLMIELSQRADRDALAAQVEALSGLADGLASERDRIAHEAEATSSVVDGLVAERDSIAVRIEALSKHADGLAAQRDSLALRVKALEASTSWKMTRPARAVARAWNALRAE